MAHSSGQFLVIVADSSELRPIPLIFNVHTQKWAILQKWPIPWNRIEELATSKSPLLAVEAVSLNLQFQKSFGPIVQAAAWFIF